MEEIAALAAVGKGTLYTYFASKEELYFAVVFEGIARLNRDLTAGAANPSDPTAQLREMVHRIVSFFSRNRFFFRLMSLEDGRTEGGKGESRRRWREERAVQLDAIEAVLLKGRDMGLFAVAHPRVGAHILRDMVRTVLTSTKGMELTDQEHVGIIMEVFLTGVRRPETDSD